MIGLIQRVTRSSVTVDEQIIGEIGQGLMVLVGVEREDSAENARKLAERVANYRIFADKDGKMNLSAKDIGGSLLAVPQFTLAADTRRGRRPSFASAAPPDLGNACFDVFCEALKALELSVATGEFGADMQVELINDGPVTFWLTG
ncbi:MAG: D-aminoacyl-tRNA deacylase [Woeseiaceae bacterium]